MNYSLQCESRSEFSAKFTTQYQRALKKGIMDKVCAHMVPRGNNRLRCIYVIKSQTLNMAYVGLTFDFNKRMWQHKNKPLNSTKLLIQADDVITEKLTDYILAEDAAAKEVEYYYEYRDLGFTMTNSERSLGLLGGSNQIYTKKVIAEIAKGYDSKKAFHDGNQGAYDAARKEDILEEVCQHMNGRTRNGLGKDLKYVKIEVLKCETRKDVRNNLPWSIYNSALKNGILDEVFGETNAKNNKPRGHWQIKQNVLDEAKRCKTRNEFSENSPGAYESAYKNDWLQEAAAHMPPNTDKPAHFWSNDDNIKQAASQCTTASQFAREYPGAYDKLSRDGRLSELPNWLAKKAD